jgi:hypothetical protein
MTSHDFEVLFSQSRIRCASLLGIGDPLTLISVAKTTRPLPPVVRLPVPLARQATAGFAVQVPEDGPLAVGDF